MTKPDKKPEAEINEDIKKQAAEAAAQTAQVPGPDFAEMEQRLAEMKDAVLRAAADAENTRKRAQKEVEDANKYGVSTFAKDLIPVLENLQRTIDLAPSDAEGAFKNVFEGVELIRKELLGIFERRGIRRIDPQPGEKFDHNLHQAIAQVEDPKFEQGAIIQSVQAGYVMHDRLLRPAMVTVSRGVVNQQNQPKFDTSA